MKRLYKMEEEGLNLPDVMPAQLQSMSVVDWLINMGRYDAAAAMLNTIIGNWHSDEYRHVLRRACRMLVEILFALEPKGPTDDVQSFVLLKVKHDEWAPSQGLAAAILKRRESRVGDLIYFRGDKPVLVKSDSWCTVCNKPGCEMACGKCKSAFYCGPEHQKVDYARHKHTCLSGGAVGSGR
jgi:hypothetical protein